MNNEFVQCSKDILGGVPVFTGTRVPIQNMIDYLEAGDSIDIFLEDFPTVKKDQAIWALGMTNSACPAFPRYQL